MATSVTVGDAAARPWKLLIGGELVDGGAGTYSDREPGHRSGRGEAPEASVQQAEEAARAAQEAFPAWSQTPVAERARLLTAVTEKLVELQDDLVPLIIAETGATAAVGSRMQVPVAIERFTRYSRDAAKNIGIALSTVAGTEHAARTGCAHGRAVNRLPVGAVACISPYNFPLTNVAGKIAPALAVGCTVVVKPAPQDPLAILILAEIMHEVGFPPGVVNVITGAEAAPAAALTSSPDIDMVSFTGSTSIGQRIYQAGAMGMKRMLLELGGKGACVVLDDGDLDNAVTAIGECVVLPLRPDLHRADARDRAPQQVRRDGRQRSPRTRGNLKVGDPLDPSTIVGPVISGIQRDRIESHIANGATPRAPTLVVDGRRPAHLERGYYVGPTLLADCKPGMGPVQEEIFGPVVVVLPFDDDEEAIAIANSTDFGLYDYVMTNDTERGYRHGEPAALGQRRREHRAAQHGGAVRRLQAQRHRPRRRRLRAACLHGDAVRHVARLTEPHDPNPNDDGGHDMSGGFLEGIRVVECALLGPNALAGHLVDFGAEVIKIESPAGDYVRQMTWPIIEGDSLLHLHMNRGKDSLVLDLKVPEAVAVFEELVRNADVVIEGMRPGFLDKRGLGYERLKELNPAIVLCSISGYGATGPYRDLPSHGIAYDTWAGVLAPVVDDDGFTAHPEPGERRHHRRARVRRARRSSPRSCARRPPVSARAWRSRSPTPPRTSTGTASRRTRRTSDRSPRSPATRPTTTSVVLRVSRACGRACGTRSTSRPTASCCSWRRSRRSGRTSAKASTAWTCSRSGRARRSPTTRSATSSSRRSCVTSSARRPRRSGSSSPTSTTRRSRR